MRNTRVAVAGWHVAGASYEDPSKIHSRYNGGHRKEAKQISTEKERRHEPQIKRGPHSRERVELPRTAELRHYGRSYLQ